MNIQTIPRDDKQVKRAFVPKLDAFLFFDYPNIELKMLAYYLSEIGRPEMAQFFREDANGDLHIKTASEMFGVAMEDVTDAQRQKGKRCNFSIVYGGGTPTLIRQKAARDFDEACGLLHRFHSAWPGIGWESKVKKQYGLQEVAASGTLVDLIKQKVASRGYVTTLWGRHLHPRATHSALNALIQGCSADLMKWAMVNVHKYLSVKKPGTIRPMESHIVNVVHDELMLDCRESEIPYICRMVPDLMTYGPLEEIVPIKPTPDISYTNWAEKETYIETPLRLWNGTEYR